MEANLISAPSWDAEGAVSSRDGTRIVFHSTGAGRPIVFVHGSLSTGAGWKAVADLLAPTWRVTTFDRRGHGQSADIAPYSFEHEVDDLLAVLREVGAGAVLVGHSFGGALSAYAAREADVAALVLYEPGFRVTEPIGEHAIAAIDDALAVGDPAGALVAGMRGVVGFTADEAEGARGMPGWDEQVALASTWPRELRGLDSLDVSAENFAQITVPTLLLRGSESPSWLRRSTAQASHLLEGSRLAELSGQSHGALATAPDLVANRILSFLETLTHSTESTR